MMHVGGYHEYRGGCSVPWGTQITIDFSPHGTEHPPRYCTHIIQGGNRVFRNLLSTTSIYRSSFESNVFKQDMIKVKQTLVDGTRKESRVSDKLQHGPPDFLN